MSSDIAVALVTEAGQEVPLTDSQRDQLLHRYPQLADDALKWTRVTNRPGRLLVIDPQIVGTAIRLFDLEDDSGQGQERTP